MEPKFADRIEWELTRACDLQCRHCYNASSQTSSPRARPRELDTDEAMTVAAELGRLGCRAVTLSGGEPTGRHDWAQIAQVLSRSGVIVQLITNGQRFGRTEARLARAAGVGAVWLSVDGCARTHDGIRRRPGAFERLGVAARGLVDADVPLGFITTVVQDNAAELTRLADWVRRWDPAVWQVWLGIPQPGRGGWLSPDALPDLVHNLATLKKTHPYLTVGDNVGLCNQHGDLRRPDDLDAPPDDLNAPHAHWAPPEGHCEAGRRVLGLRSDGTITGCLALPGAQGVGNVRQSPLTHLWRAAGRARDQRLAQLAGACADCHQVAQCQAGCHAMALATTGQLDNPYCLNRPAQAPQVVPRPARRVAGMAASGMAASLAVASMLGAGCGPKQAPVQAEQRVPPVATPDGGTDHTQPADQPPAKTAPPAPPTPPTKASPSRRQPPRAGRSIPCQYSHIGCYHLRRHPRTTKPRRKP
jgi:radical SAM protein with 4Fe4S-binding SPASM domain